MTSTLGDALDTATAYWGQGKGGRVQAARSRVCLEPLGGPARELSSIKAGDGTALLTWLRKEDYSAESIGSYYATVRTMLRLNGIGTEKWPRPPKKPRKPSREPISDADIARLVEWFQGAAYPQTADLCALLKGTGLRVDIEALDRDALAYDPQPDEGYGVLTVIGKGGHQRVIPVVDLLARAILADPVRLERMRRVSYKTHLARWNRALKALGVTSLKPTPHAVRHSYGTNALDKSGGNLRLAQELLGHSSPATTARYLKVDMDRMAGAL